MHLKKYRVNAILIVLSLALSFFVACGPPDSRAAPMTPLKDYGPDDPNYKPGVHISGYRSGGNNAVDKVVDDVKSEMSGGYQPSSGHGNAVDQTVGAVKAEQERQKQAQQAMMDAAKNQRR